MKTQGGFGFQQIVLVVVLLVGGFAGWSAYQKHLSKEEAAAIAMQIRDATDRVRQQVEFFKSPRGETYGEVLAATDASIKAIEASVASVRQISDPRNPALIKHAIDYLRASQESIRSLRALVRAKADLAAAASAAGSAITDLKTYIGDPSDDANKFHSDVARYSVGPIVKRIDSADAALDSAARATGKALSNLVAVAAQRPATVSADNYVTADDVSGISFKAL